MRKRKGTGANESPAGEAPHNRATSEDRPDIEIEDWPDDLEQDRNKVLEPIKPAGAPRLPEDRIDDAVLALLLLGLHEHYRAWKGFDWDAMDRLHRKGMISNPQGRAKSVIFSEEGLRRAEELYEALFVKGSAPNS